MKTLKEIYHRDNLLRGGHITQEQYDEFSFLDDDSSSNDYKWALMITKGAMGAVLVKKY